MVWLPTKQLEAQGIMKIFSPSALILESEQSQTSVLWDRGFFQCFSVAKKRPKFHIFGRILVFWRLGELILTFFDVRDSKACQTGHLGGPF